MENLNGLFEFGIVGGSFLLMLFQSFKREERLMTFMQDMRVEMEKMSQAYVKLSEDVEDIKRNTERKE